MANDIIRKVFVRDGIVTVLPSPFIQPKRIYAIIDYPHGVTAEQIAKAIEAVNVMQRTENGVTVSTTYGDLRLEEVLQFKLLAASAQWQLGRVRDISDCALAIEDNLGSIQMRHITGNDLGTKAWHNQRLREEFAIGAEIYYKLTDDGSIGAIRHPKPKIAQFGLDVLAWRGLTRDMIIDLVLPEITMFHREEINLELTDDGWQVTSRSTLNNTDIIEFTAKDGIIDCAAGTPEMGVGPDHFIHWNGVFPETIRASMPGQPLSKFVELPFPHHDPIIASVECSPGPEGSTFFELETTMCDVLSA